MNANRSPRRAHRPSARNFYQGVLETATTADLAAAATTEGLDDEIALLRLLIRRELAANPDDLRLALQGLTLLVRAVVARYRLNPADEADLEARLVNAVQALSAVVEEGARDG